MPKSAIAEQSKKGEFDRNMSKKKWRAYVTRQVFKGEDYLPYDQWAKQPKGE